MNGTPNELVHWAERVKKNPGTIVVLGIVTMIAGILSLAMPWASGVGVAMFVGFAMLLGGIARLIAAFHAGSFGSGTLAFLGGGLTFLAGVILIARPATGLAVLTLMLGGFLLVDGIFGAVLAFQVRPNQGWAWMLFSALMSALLGFLLLKEWPLSGLWAIGTLVGVNLLFTGASLLSVGSAARKLAKHA